MIGAIVGDIAGSIYEFHNIKTRDFTLFADYLGRRARPTDDSVMTLAPQTKNSMSPARDPSRRPLRRSSSPTASNTQSATPSPSVATATPSPPSQAPSPVRDGVYRTLLGP